MLHALISNSTKPETMVVLETDCSNYSFLSGDRRQIRNEALQTDVTYIHYFLIDNDDGLIAYEYIFTEERGPKGFNLLVDTTESLITDQIERYNYIHNYKPPFDTVAIENLNPYTFYSVKYHSANDEVVYRFTYDDGTNLYFDKMIHPVLGIEDCNIFTDRANIQYIRELNDIK